MKVLAMLVLGFGLGGCGSSSEKAGTAGEFVYQREECSGPGKTSVKSVETISKTKSKAVRTYMKDGDCKGEVYLVTVQEKAATPSDLSGITSSTDEKWMLQKFVYTKYTMLPSNGGAEILNNSKLYDKYFGVGGFQDSTEIDMLTKSKVKIEASNSLIKFTSDRAFQLDTRSMEVFKNETIDTFKSESDFKTVEFIKL